MAEEVKKIITIEVGKSITSVRDFKKHIEDLRGALLGLNEDSEEYAQIAEQIATDQAKLNDVMKIGKTNTDAAAGSYIELNNQLKALRNQYKALSETERNSTTGQAILTNINKLDTQLKDIDASMGQYQRNVGNYKGAFEEAFKAVSRDIGNINPKLGQLMSTASSLIPLIKKASTAATTGLKGVKAALASTGIGLLVVALGEIVAHWEEISNWARKVLGIQKEIIQETKNSADAARDYAQELSDAYDEYDRLWRRQGLNAEERAQRAATIATSYRQINEAEITQTQMYIQWLDRLSKQSKTINKTKAYDALNEFYANLDKFEEGLIHEVDKQSNEIKRLDKIGQAAIPTQLPAVIKQVQAEFQKDLDLYKSRTQGLVDDEEAKLKALDNIKIDQIETIRKRGKDAANAIKSEEEQIKAAYDEEIEMVINSELSLEEQNQIILNLTNEFNKKISDLRKRQWESSPAYQALQKDKQDAQNIIESLKNYGKNELEILDNNYQEQKALLERFGYDTTVLTKKYLDDRQAIIDRDTQEGLEKLKEAEEEALKIRQDAFQKQLALQQNTEYLDTSAASTMWTINTKTHETDEDLEYQKSDRLYQIAEQGYQDRIELYRQYLSTLEEGTDEYLEISRDMHTEEMELAQLQYNYQVELEDRLLEKKRKNLQIMQGMFQAYGELGSTIAGIIADASEEGTKKWKAARITETVINTISGAAGAFMQGMSSYPQPWGAIIGAAGAAVATATGMAEISKIKATQIGSSSVSGLSPQGSGVGVEPLLNQDYDLQRITNLSLQSDAYLPGNTQVYVLESDIQEVGRRVQVREQNATF